MRVLFTCRPLSGHFDPLLGLARGLTAAGNDVAFASGEPVATRAGEAGFEAFVAGPAESFRHEWAPRYPQMRSLVGDAQREFFFTEIFARLELVPRLADLEVIVDRWRPDVVVHEVAELAAPLVCSAREIPYATMAYGPAVPVALLEAAGRAAAPEWRARGLEPLPLAGVGRHLYLDTCPPLLQRSPFAAAAVQLVRPMTVQPVADRPAWLAALPNERTVYVTLGTIWNSNVDIFRLAIDALAQRANIVVTVGRQNDPSLLGVQPANVVVERFIPQDDVLPWCDAAVVHGGAGTVIGALAHGVPLLVVPQGADQWTNAALVTTCGAGVQLLADEISSEAIGAAVTALLRDPSYRQRAAAVASDIAAMPDVEEAVVAVMRLGDQAKRLE